jgi:hypothetical protein
MKQNKQIKEIEDNEDRYMIEAKFQYGQLIKITKGFYKGITARIHDFKCEEKEILIRFQSQQIKQRVIYYKIVFGNSKDSTLKVLWLNEDSINRTLF